MNDGGPAFPPPVTDCDECRAEKAGMSLRDYFAAQALRVMSPITAKLVVDEIARRAYNIADAMLAARERKGPIQ